MYAPLRRLCESQIQYYLRSYFALQQKFSVFSFGSRPYNRPTMKTLLKELIRAESTTEKGESAAAEVLRSQFHRSGIDRSEERRVGKECTG